MSQLNHDGGTIAAALVREFLQPRYDLILVGVEIAEGGGRICRYDRGASGHGERYATLRPLDMVQPVAILRHSVIVIKRLMRRDHEPVLERQMLELEWLKERIARHV